MWLLRCYPNPDANTNPTPQLTGSIPTELGRWVSLTTSLQLYDNSFCSDIPAEVCVVCYAVFLGRGVLFLGVCACALIVLKCGWLAMAERTLTLLKPAFPLFLVSAYPPFPLSSLFPTPLLGRRRWDRDFAECLGRNANRASRTRNLQYGLTPPTVLPLVALRILVALCRWGREGRRRRRRRRGHELAEKLAQAVTLSADATKVLGRSI